MKKSEKIEKYKIVLDICHQESQNMWQVFGHFILANSIIVAFSIHSIGVARLYTSLLGIVVCAFWYLSFQRRWSWYVFRIAQAKKIERSLKGWSFLSDGATFSNGGRVLGLRHTYIVRILKTEPVTKLLIVSFGVFYAIIATL